MKIVALAGGVGGAKLVDGLAQILPPDDLCVVVNTADDFDHLGLRICPDLDTITYTLAGLANPKTGWGRADESWAFLETLEHLGGPVWFRLGDRDLALHIERTRRLKQGLPLTEVTRQICLALGVGVAVLPMADEPVATIVLTDKGELPFQEYFVAQRCEPKVKGFEFVRGPHTAASARVQQALAEAEAVVLCPSNPWVSLDPILDLPGVREGLPGRPVVGVSPIVGGKALRGPAAKMFNELGIQPSALAVADHYRKDLRGFILDTQDRAQAEEVSAMGMDIRVTNTIMTNAQDRRRLAQEVLQFVGQLLQGASST